jgi:hypothetical protein
LALSDETAAVFRFALGGAVVSDACTATAAWKETANIFSPAVNWWV